MFELVGKVSKTTTKILEYSRKRNRQWPWPHEMRWKVTKQRIKISNKGTRIGFLCRIMAMGHVLIYGLFGSALCVIFYCACTFMNESSQIKSESFISSTTKSIYRIESLSFFACFIALIRIYDGAYKSMRLDNSSLIPCWVLATPGHNISYP